jgi:hypothetical protein
MSIINRTDYVVSAGHTDARYPADLRGARGQ